MPEDLFLGLKTDIAIKSEQDNCRSQEVTSFKAHFYPAQLTIHKFGKKYECFSPGAKQGWLSCVLV